MSREKKIVLYGLGAVRASQGQLLLRLKGYEAYSLREGLSAWWENVMTPTSVRSATEESPAGYQEAKVLPGYFSGQAPPDVAAPAQVVPPPVPAKEQPSQEQKQKEQLRLGRGCS